MEIRKTQFYKIMYEVYDVLLRDGRLFKKGDEKGKTKIIDNIITECLLDQLEKIIEDVPTILSIIPVKGLIDNKDKEFSSEGMYKRDCPFKQQEEEKKNNKTIRRVLKREKGGKKEIKTWRKQIGEVFLTENIEEKNKIDLDEKMRIDHIVTIKEKDIKKILTKEDINVFLKFMSDNFKEIEKTNNIVDHMYINSSLFKKIKNIFDNSADNYFSEDSFWTATIHIDDRFKDIYLTNGEKKYTKLKRQKISSTK